MCMYLILLVALLLPLPRATQCKNVSAVCAEYTHTLSIPQTHFLPRPPGTQAALLYDAFLFNNEWEILEIRLAALDAFVHRCCPEPSLFCSLQWHRGCGALSPTLRCA